MTYILGEASDLDPGVGDNHGLLELGGEFSILRHRGPVVGPSLVSPDLGEASCEHWSTKKALTPSEIIGSMVKQCPGFITPTALFFA